MDNRRKHTRFTLAIAAEIEFGGQLFEGETRDLSAGGVSVFVDEPLDEGVQVELTLVLTQDGIEDADEEDLKTRAEVMWAAPSGEDGCMVGLRFSGLGPNEARRLSRFLAAFAENTR